ncbi:MAG: hypothetical protein NTY01_19160 [Verrucomicrobia bacterium]|nr:hypothetical protein [Verrucomicrobiota bacterium]
MRSWASKLTLLLAGAAVVFAAPPEIVLHDLPLLFADDSGIAASNGVVRTVHPARTLGAPVIEPDRPWEGSRVYIYGSVYFDKAARQLRMWYMSRPQAYSGDCVLYATSQDGVRWTKPLLGIHALGSSTDNNIVFDIHSPSVLLDTRETDPAKRYKMLGSKGGGYHAAFSADGLRWTSYPRNPVLKFGDTITLSQDHATGEYLAFHKRPAKVRGFGRRVVWLSRSRDFQTWTGPELVFAPDAEDDAWAKRPNERTEVYNMSVFPHAVGFIGLPTIFRVTVAGRPKSELTPGQSPDDGPIDVQLATSADGRTWRRTQPRLNVIPRGAPGTFDGGSILGVSSTAVHVGDETWVYYTAMTTTHGGPMPPKRLSIGRAAWRRHGFVSLDAAEHGRVETKPLRLGASSLVINADASRGQLRVALLEADGRAIGGFALEDSEPLRADATRWTTRWRSGASVPADRPVRVVVEMSNARLFSMSSGRENK